MTTNLIFVRHGESEYNRLNRLLQAELDGTATLASTRELTNIQLLLPRMDIDAVFARPDSVHRLTKHGRTMVGNATMLWLNQLLRDTGERNPLLYASPYLRTLETARLLCLDGNWTISGTLAERDFGSAHRLTPKDRLHISGYRHVNDCRYGDGHFYRPVEGETAAELVRRVSRWLARLSTVLQAGDQPKTVVIVTHGEVIWAARHLLMGINFLEPLPETDPMLKIANGSIFHAALADTDWLSSSSKFSYIAPDPLHAASRQEKEDWKNWATTTVTCDDPSARVTPSDIDRILDGASRRLVD